MKRTNWSLTWFRGSQAIICDAEFDEGEFDGESHTETFFVSTICPRGYCGEGEPGVGCVCTGPSGGSGLLGDDLLRFQVGCGPSWWSVWGDDLDYAEPVEAGELLKIVPLAVLAQWHAEMETPR